MYHTIWRKQKPIKKVKNKTVNAGSITRVEDKNTSIISTGSTLDAEILWKMNLSLYYNNMKQNCMFCKNRPSSGKIDIF